jgi:Fe-S-cluster containining protein
MTTNQENLQALWHNYLEEQAAQNKNTAAKQTAKIETDFVFKEPLENFQCQIKNCLQCCCKNQGQKIRLLLKDIAVLLDNDLRDNIIGKYSPKEDIEKFLNDPRPENIYQTPYLKRKKDKAGLDECVFLTEKLECSIWQFTPYICKTYPAIMEQKMTSEKQTLSFLLDKQCSCTREEMMAAPKDKAYTQRLLNDVIAERIEADRTTKLLIHHRKELEELGFDRFL